MTRLSLLTIFLLVSAAANAAPAEDYMMMGSVVKSDKWKMDRAKDIEIFTGNVSFNNPRYTIKSDYAVYNHLHDVWDLTGSVYALRVSTDNSRVEMTCDRAKYFKTLEEAYLERGAAPVKMKYVGADGRVLNSRSDHAFEENKKGLMHFYENFAMATENLDAYSQNGLYDSTTNTFLLYNSTEAVPQYSSAKKKDPPVAIGKREGYDFAIDAESIKFFRDSRDIYFYNRVSGWVKDLPGRKTAKDTKTSHKNTSAKTQP